MTISGSLDVKRLYLNKKLTQKCPNCGVDCARDFNDHYLSYPPINTPFITHFYCEKCEHEWETKVILGVTLGFSE